MVAMVQLHDATGSNDPNELVKCAQWFTQRMWLWNKYKRNTIINIANEWSTFGTRADGKIFFFLSNYIMISYYEF